MRGKIKNNNRLLTPHFIAGLFAGLLTVNTCQAISITTSINWASCQLPDTLTNAGDYYASSIESSTLTCADATLSVSGAASSTTNWTITSRLLNSPAGLNVDLMRSGNGSGDSTPAGGNSYATQTTAAQVFFTGTGNVSLIPIRFKISNFDVSDGHGTQNIQLSYEVTETP